MSFIEDDLADYEGEDEFQEWYDQLCSILSGWDYPPDRGTAELDYASGMTPEESANSFIAGEEDVW